MLTRFSTADSSQPAIQTIQLVTAIAKLATDLISKNIGQVQEVGLLPANSFPLALIY